MALIGPPGAGCRSVAAAVARLRGRQVPARKAGDEGAAEAVGEAVDEAAGAPVGAVVDAAVDAAVVDLAALTAASLGVGAEHALVAVGEQAYRRAEAAAVVEALERAVAAGDEGVRGAPGGGAVLALGSGWVDEPQARRALEAFAARGGRVVALGAQGRVLAARNGLNAPRSVALGPVHHQFIGMLRRREEACRALAEAVIDTSSTSPDEAARHVLGHLGAPS
nr:shikimate kinase [Actinomyces bowdenii]